MLTTSNIPSVFSFNNNVNLMALATNENPIIVELTKYKLTELEEKNQKLFGCFHHERWPVCYWTDFSKNQSDNAIEFLEKYHFNRINWYNLSSNTCNTAIKVLEKHLDKIQWSALSGNKNAIHILEKNIDKIDWKELSTNVNAIHILEKNLDKVCWNRLSLNTNAIHILEKNLDQVNWGLLSENSNAVHLLEANPDKIDYYCLSNNVNAIHIIEKNIDKIDWCWLSANENAIELLEKNIDKVHWRTIGFNRNAIKLIKANLDTFIANAPSDPILCGIGIFTNTNAIDIIEEINKRSIVNWYALSQNKNALHLLTKINYKELKRINANFFKDLAEYVNAPPRLLRMSEMAGMELFDYVETL
jgi:hypothetical protein